MLRFLFLFLIAALGTQAGATTLSDTYAQWNRLRSPDTESIRFTDGYQFLEKHPGWPEEKIIRLRTEAAALAENPAKTTMEPFCTEQPPLSGRGMIACALAGVGSSAQQTQWIKQGWLQGDFNRDEEERILKRYGKTLTRDDHHARMERLLYDGSTKAAKRMLPLVDHAKHSIFSVRIAMASNEHKASRQLDHLSQHDRATAGIIFERARWRLKHDSDADITDLLLSAPKDAPYPERWWPLRATAARDNIAKRRYDRALAVLEHAGDVRGEALADVLWMRGWIHLRHKGDAGSGYKEFFKLYTSVYTPVSKARAAYWAGRAAEKNGNPDIAHEWMEKAARHPTVFYGQLAHEWLYPGKPLPLPEAKHIEDDVTEELSKDPLAQIARKLAKTGDEKTRDLFLSTIARRTTQLPEFNALAAMGKDLGGVATGVEIAKLALRNGMVLLPFGWPVIDIPDALPIEPSLTLSITRQESEFNPIAVSPAGARGLMQLLPSTARQMARALGRPHKPAMLDMPTENLTLGSHYLGRLIAGFDGSYILGIASYNAGPANVRRWIDACGAPPKTIEGAIDWIESIPFGETRNYVMRVLENLNVYRALAKPERSLALTQDLIR